MIESQASWEEFCNDISLETNHTESWRKMKNFFKPKGQHGYPALRLNAKTTKTNTDRGNSLPNLSKNTLAFRVITLIRNTLMRSMDDDHDLVADNGSDTLIRIVKFLKRGKAPGHDNIHNEVLRLGTTTSLLNDLPNPHHR